MNAPTPSFKIFAKHDCPTCVLVQPVLRALEAAGVVLTVYMQDETGFPEGVNGVVADTGLEQSWRHHIETVPTLIRVEAGSEVARTVGWDRVEWERMTGVASLGTGLSDFQPGCGSKSVDPGMAEVLEVRFGEPSLVARRLDVQFPEDEQEVCYARGWSDGLPVVPPTPERVLRMLAGTTRDPGEVIGKVPPDYGVCTVEKSAINAVMAGCKPEYLPVVLAAVEAVLEPAFAVHGLLCTTYFSAPIVIVNGPITRRIGMNCGVNALGQGNRANATIGRALQLIVRNVGGGVPGGIDRATLGTPGKYTFCFAEDESDEGWEPLSVERGFAPGTSTVTVFGGGGVIPNRDEASRNGESLARSFALTLNTVGHPRQVGTFDALVVLSPEHYAIFAESGWDRARIKKELRAATIRSGAELMAGAGGVAVGVSPDKSGGRYEKFRDGGLQIVRAGGEAGLMSAIIGGWAASGARGTVPVSKEVGT